MFLAKLVGGALISLLIFLHLFALPLVFSRGTDYTNPIRDIALPVLGVVSGLCVRRLRRFLPRR